jgi:hypothetical protein
LSQDIGLYQGQPSRAHDKGRSDKKAHSPGFKIKGVLLIPGLKHLFFPDYFERAVKFSD